MSCKNNEFFREGFLDKENYVLENEDTTNPTYDTILNLLLVLITIIIIIICIVVIYKYFNG